MKLIPFSTILVAILFIASCSQQDVLKPSDLRLWYGQPAQKWEEALPVGNGRIGAMVFGDPQLEHLQLNDDSMWPGDPASWTQPEGRPKDLAHIRNLLKAGNNQQADSVFVDKFSNKSVGRSHQTLGDLTLSWDHQNITEYVRDLDLTTAVSTVSYKTDGYLVSEKVFASCPDQALVMEITSEAPDGLNGALQLSRPEDNGHPTVQVTTAADHLLIMRGEVTQYGGAFQSQPFPITEGVKFETRLQVETIDGEVLASDQRLILKNVHKARLVIVSNSDYYHADYPAENEKQLARIAAKTTDQLLQAHIADYQALFSKTRLEVAHESTIDLPTDQRLDSMKTGNTDVGLEMILFQYGRYLLISSSREGTNPANLQGLWNPHLSAPWNGDYHLNINLQMNYWLANLTNLAALNHPLFDYIDQLVANGHQTATVNFGCRGSFIPHATDLWGSTWLRAPTAYWGCSVGAGGWMMQHYWQHVLFTQDTSFLEKRAFPAMHEVAQFYSDWLVEDPRDGYLVSAPSTSPENQFILPSGGAAATCMGSAMDQQIIHEVFANYLTACSWLGIDNALKAAIEEQLPKLRPGFVVGEDGRILEWDRPYGEYEPGHRHMSHLYGFHPGTAVNKTDQPELVEAVKKTLDHRLANGGAGTGWSRAWLINLSARLGDGEMAHDHINLLFAKSMYPNLFDMHPPFQIDGNFGFTAGVAEMLVQSHAGYIEVLPALPKAYADGTFEGLNVRGNGQMSAKWTQSKLTECRLLANSPGIFELRLPHPTNTYAYTINEQPYQLLDTGAPLKVALKEGDVLTVHHQKDTDL